MMENQKLEELERLCLKIRKEIAGYGCQSGRGHISSALSMVEILTVLYFGINISLCSSVGNGEHICLLVSNPFLWCFIL